MGHMSYLSTRRLLLVSLGAAVLFLSLLAGCSQAARPNAEPTATLAPPTATPLPRGGTLKLRLAEDVPELRPWQPRSRGEEQASALLYSGLMRLDDQLRPIPDLAESWTTTPDGHTITFSLRSKLSWHDGAPLEADDVLFTLERLRALPPTSTALLADLRYISAASAPDPATVVITLTGRYAPMLALLTLPILPRHLLEERDLASMNFWDLPVGSGPFQVASVEPGRAYRLERFANFHRGAPLLDGVDLLVEPDPSAARAALAEGRLHLAELPWAPLEPLPPGVRSAAYPENGYYFLGFNLREGRPFADPRLREALATAIDLPRLVEVATKGQGLELASSALPGAWADLSASPTSGADLPAARALLDTAGWRLPPGATIRERDGVPLTATLYVRADDERRLLAARQIAETAASLGMQIEVEAAPFASVILARYAPPFDFDLLLGSWSNGAGDPDFADVAFYDPDDFALFHSSQLNQGAADARSTRNVVGYSSPEYDRYAQTARQLYNLDERSAAIRQAQAQLAADRPYLFLWTDRITVLLSEQINTLDGPVELASPRYDWNIERWHFQP